MKKQNGNNLMQKWKNKAGVRLSALDKKETGSYKSSLCSDRFLCGPGILLIQEQSWRRYREQTVICDGTCRSDLYRDSVEL